MKNNTTDKEPTDGRRRGEKAYHKKPFMNSSHGRPLRILSEYLEPKSRLDRYEVEDTIVFMGSARLPSKEIAEAEIAAAAGNPEALARAQGRLEISRYYEEARELARRFTEWSKALPTEGKRFVVCTGGGPGIMEAAARGAAEAKGVNVGLTISLPNEEFGNPYVTRGLDFHFHYFFMRKFWFAYLAKALLVFPGGFGTLDELFEILTLRQTQKMKKPLSIILFGTKYWSEVINFDALVRHGTIDAADLGLFHRTDSLDEAFDIITRHLTKRAIDKPGATL
jgi:uncharacterized protein (TIGR00730 family)